MGVVRDRDYDLPTGHPTTAQCIVETKWPLPDSTPSPFTSPVGALTRPTAPSASTSTTRGRRSFPAPSPTPYRSPLLSSPPSAATRPPSPWPTPSRSPTPP